MDGFRKRKKLTTFYLYASRSYVVSYFIYARKHHEKVKNPHLKRTHVNIRLCKTDPKSNKLDILTSKQ